MDRKLADDAGAVIFRYNGLGMVEVELNEMDAARESFSKAVDLNPDFPAAYRNLARISFA